MNISEPREIDRGIPLPGAEYQAKPAFNHVAGAPGATGTATPPSESRAHGTPLPMGAARFRSSPPPGRTLPGAGTEEGSGLNRAIGALKQAMPFVQKLLPLIDGNIATALASFLTSRPHTPPPPPVDLIPVQNQVGDLQLQQRDLRNQVAEQNVALKRMESQLEMVREATDRNTLEQQELIEDLKAVGNKVNMFALLLFGMLLISVLLNLVLFLHIKQIFP